MVITGTLPAVRGLILFPTQIISGICAAAVAKGIIPGNIKTVQTTLAPGVSVAQGVFLEMVRPAPNLPPTETPITDIPFP